MVEPAANAPENTVVHTFINHVFQSINAAAAAVGLQCNKAFYEWDAEDVSGRPDWIFTQPTEQRHCAFNKCFVVEGKPLTRGRVSTDTLLCEGVAQALKRLAARQIELQSSWGNGALFGVAAIIACTKVKFIRVNFAAVSGDPFMPIYCTSVMDFVTFDAVTSTAAPVACPPGFRMMVRMMLEHDITRFGLRADTVFTLPSPLVYQGALGVGGFSTVLKCSRDDDLLPYALKCMNNAHPDGSADADELARMLQVEVEILNKLQEAGVPRVPVVVDAKIVDAMRPSQFGVLLRPVGTPLTEHVKRPEVDFAAVARQLVAQISETLAHAHLAGIVHGDVRPSNIIVVERMEPAAAGPVQVDFVLIDWALGQDGAAKRDGRKVRGQPAFMCDEMLTLKNLQRKASWTPTPQHDLQSLVYTFAAIWCLEPGSNVSVPQWPTYVAGKDQEDRSIQARRAWMAEHLSAAVRAELPGALQAAAASTISGGSAVAANPRSQ